MRWCGESGSGRRLPALRSCLLGALMTASTTVAWAQPPSLGVQVLRALDLTPPPHGARSVGLAGTGIGMPDDATAAALNPAALRLLVRAEVTGTVRLHQRYAPALANVSLPATAADLSFGREPFTRNEEVSFAVAYPFARFAVGGFYVGGETPTVSLPGVTTPRDAFLTNGAAFGGSGIQQWGASVSVSLHPTLSIGAGLLADITRYHAQWCQQFTTAIASSCSVLLTSATDEKMRFGYQVGGSWSPTPRVSVGVVSRRGTTHPLTTALAIAPAGRTLATWTADLRTPDQVGAGVGVRVTELFRLLADVTRTNYSQTTAGVASILQTTIAAPSELETPDATQLRLGAEYAIPFRENSIALRGGIWREDAHAVTYLGANPFWRSILPADTGAVVHRTVGVGFGTGRFEAGAGADLSDTIKTFIVSALLRFK
jgi:long-subunit fatty acid transport protein